MSSLKTDDPDELGRITEVYEKRRSITTYDKATLFDIVPIEDMIKYGLITPNVTACKKYEEKHGVDLKGNKVFSKPFLGGRKKK